MSDTGVEITAGLGGFLVLFGLALAVWFLGADLSRRLRRMRLREQERLEQERLEQQRLEQERRARGPRPPASDADGGAAEDGQ